MRVLVIVMAVAVLVSLPCLVVAALSYDQVIDRTRSRFRRRFDGSRRCGLSWRQRRGLVRLDRTLPAATPETGPVGPPIEQVAADLRRLGRQRTGVATRSPIWFAAVQKAYDERLCLACRELGIEQHLCELKDLDLEIERVRVEGALVAAGLRLHAVEAPRP